MCDKCFLKRLAKNEIKWTAESLKTVKRLGKKGYAEYKTALHAWWWEITENGRKFSDA